MIKFWKNKEQVKTKRRTFLVIDLKSYRTIYLNTNNYDFIAEHINKNSEHVYIEKGLDDNFDQISKITIKIDEIQLMYIQRIAI